MGGMAGSMTRVFGRPTAAAFLILAGCAAPPPMGALKQASADIDWSKAETVRVTLTDFEFGPENLTFRTGVPIRLMLVNSGSGKHDFSAPEFFASAAFRAGAPLPEKGKVGVKEGQTAELDLIPQTAGSYKLECTEFLHAMFGMTGNIAVSN